MYASQPPYDTGLVDHVRALGISDYDAGQDPRSQGNRQGGQVENAWGQSRHLEPSNDLFSPSSALYNTTASLFASNPQSLEITIASGNDTQTGPYHPTPSPFSNTVGYEPNSDGWQEWHPQGTESNPGPLNIQAIDYGSASPRPRSLAHQAQSARIPSSHTSSAKPHKNRVPRARTRRPRDPAPQSSSPPQQHTVSGSQEYDFRGYCCKGQIAGSANGLVEKVQHRDKNNVVLARKTLFRRNTRNKDVQTEVDNIKRAAHDHVIEVLEKYDTDDYIYIVMPYCRLDLGTYLDNLNCEEDQLRRRRPLTDAQWRDYEQQRTTLVQWIYCLATAVDYIHSQDIRHRDIKPSNILIRNSEVYLADFGLSFCKSDATGEGYTGVGSARYMPPRG